MIIFPAIDLLDRCAVRLFQGDYKQSTLYDNNPVDVAKRFKEMGTEYLHTVDLNGAKSGTTVNYDIVASIVRESGLNVEIGGGIRNIDTISKYLDCGIWRVILGTAAYKDPDFLLEALQKFGPDKIVVGVDMKDGDVAINGWLEKSNKNGIDFMKELMDKGVTNVICTDISKDGALRGPNRALYETLAKELPTLNIVASGGVTTIEDIKYLQSLDLYGAILGKAIYTNALDLREVFATTRGGNNAN